MKKWCLCFALIFCGFILPMDAAAPQADHVVLISIDGLRPDAIDAAKAVTLLEYIKEGAYCSKAKTVRPSLTVSGHASMLTGLDAPGHKAIWNDYKPGNISVPTVFAVVKKSGRSTAAFVGKPKLYPMVPKESLDFRYISPVPANWNSINPKLVKAGVRKSYASAPDTTARGIAKAFAVEWPKKKFALTFVHFRETDVAGHRYDWMSDEYLDAVRVCDHAVRSIRETIQMSGLGPRTVVIITTDHGGHDFRHDQDIPENNTIFWICAGPGVPKGLTIDREVRIFDTMPTVLTLLGIPVPKKLDGKPVKEVLSR